MIHWNATDSLELRIKSFPAEEVKNVRLDINISYDAYLLTHKSSPVKVNEGACSKIRSSLSFIYDDMIR